MSSALVTQRGIYDFLRTILEKKYRKDLDHQQEEKKRRKEKSSPLVTPLMSRYGNGRGIWCLNDDKIVSGVG